MNTLEEKHLAAINENISGYQSVHDSDPILIAGKELLVTACTEITIEFAKGFYEWARNERYEKYWGNDGPNNGKWYVGYTPPSRQYFTTDELIQKYIDTLK